MRTGLTRILIPLGFLSFLVAGCLFSPRDPDPGGGEVCYESVAPKTVESLFVNLDESLKCLQQSSYSDQLGLEFVFEPTPSAEATFPDAFGDEWDRETEEFFLSQLFSTSDSLDATLRISDVQQPTGDPNVGPYCITAEYSVRRVSGGSALTYTGVAEYTLELFATSWTLTRWVDRDTQSAESISTLRGGLLGGGASP